MPNEFLANLSKEELLLLEWEDLAKRALKVTLDNQELVPK